MARRHYSSTAVETTVAAPGLAPSATLLNVASATGFPSTCPFTLVLGEGTISEEVVEVSSMIGTALTVVRGIDSTPSINHNVGDSVKHAVSARDYDEANAHNNASSDVHGISGNLSTFVSTTANASVATHSALTSGVHGFAPGSNIKGYVDTGDAANATALTTHAGVGSNIHGVTGSIEGRLSSSEGRLTATESVANTATSNLSTHIANGTGVHGVTGNLSSVITSGDQARYCSVRQSANYSIMGFGGWVGVPMNTEWTDSQGWHTGTSNTIQPTEVGVYLVQGGLQWDINNVGVRGARLIVNNGSVLELAVDIRGADTQGFWCPAHALSAVVWLNGSTHFVAIEAMQDHGGGGAGLNILANTAWFTVTRLGAQ